MRALCWRGTRDVRIESVPDPAILNPRDVILRVTSTAICGSAVTNLAVGDRVVVPFTIACGACGPCRRELWSLCDNSNPNAWLAAKLYGYSGSGLFGYSHIYGGYAGGQAEYVRVPFADVGPIKVPASLPDERVLLLSDIFPTAYMAAENADIRPGATVAVWGCGPVGLLTIKCAYALGAERVIAIDRVATRLDTASTQCRAETINFEETDVLDALRTMTAGRGPDACIDAVGMEAHGGASLGARYDRAKMSMYLATDRLEALRQAIMACGKGGVVSIPGVYGGYLDKVPMGAAFAKGLTLRMGQTHVHRYLGRLLDMVEREVIDPSFVISHTVALDDAPSAYRLFLDKAGGCTKVVLKP